jgi:phage terminase small subunit
MTVTNIRDFAKKAGKLAKYKPPKAPRHLTKEMRQWWEKVVRGWELDDHHILLLTKAAEAHDRADQARKILRQKGVTFLDRFKQPCARPEVAIERDSRLSFARLVRELNLSEAPEAPRPPGLKYSSR